MSDRDEHTPTTDMVRGKYAMVLDETAGWTWSKEWGGDFDRWLAREKAKAATEALEKAADHLHPDPRIADWLSTEETAFDLRVRAERIRREAGIESGDGRG